MGKTRKWAEAEPSNQSPRYTKNLHQWSKITQKQISKSLALSSFAQFLRPISNQPWPRLQVSTTED